MPGGGEGKVLSVKGIFWEMEGRGRGGGMGEDGGVRNGFKDDWLKRDGRRWLVGFQLGEKTQPKISGDPIFNTSVITFLVAISLSLWSLINSVYSLLFTMHERGAISQSTEYCPIWTKHAIAVPLQQTNGSILCEAPARPGFLFSDFFLFFIIGFCKKLTGDWGFIHI